LTKIHTDGKFCKTFHKELIIKVLTQYKIYTSIDIQGRFFAYECLQICMFSGYIILSRAINLVQME